MLVSNICSVLAFGMCLASNPMSIYVQIEFSLCESSRLESIWIMLHSYFVSVTGFYCSFCVIHLTLEPVTDSIYTIPVLRVHDMLSQRGCYRRAPLHVSVCYVK